MKKLVLLLICLMFVMIGGLVYATTTPWGAPWGLNVTPSVTDFVWSPYFYLTGNVDLASTSAAYYIGYDDIRRTSCMMIAYGSPTRTFLWAFENENPKLYNDIKNTINNHLEGRKAYKSYFNSYGKLSFLYKGSDGLNIIKAVVLSTDCNPD